MSKNEERKFSEPMIKFNLDKLKEDKIKYDPNKKELIIQTKDMKDIHFNIVSISTAWGYSKEVEKETDIKKVAEEYARKTWFFNHSMDAPESKIEIYYKDKLLCTYDDKEENEKVIEWMLSYLISVS